MRAGAIYNPVVQVHFRLHLIKGEFCPINIIPRIRFGITGPT